MHFNGAVGIGDSSVELNGQTFEIPEQLEGCKGDIAFGVRPEHVTISSDGNYRGKVVATEYLGTTQIVTMETPNGTLKARIASSQEVTVGETVALGFNPKTITLFNESTGVALLSVQNKGVLSDG